MVTMIKLDSFDTDNAKKAVEEIQKMGKPNPIGNGLYKSYSNNHLVMFEVYRNKDKIWLKDVRVVPAKEGTGSKFMKELIKVADKWKVAVTLDPVPYDESITKAKLKAFYKKFGFKNWTQGQMIREPKT